MPATDASRAVSRFRALALLAGCAAVLAAAAARPAAAQDTVPARAAVRADSVHEIRLTDGSRIFGTLVEENDARVVVVTPAGARIELARSQIASISALGGSLVNGEFWPEDPHATRLFLGPTGRPLAAGEGYVGDFELFVPFVAYGVTDRFTLGAATIVAPEVTGQAFALVPKLEVLRRPRASVSIGAAAGFLTEEIDAGTFGVAFGVGTFGSRDRSITVGAGFPFYASGNDSDFGHTPIVLVGGELRSSAHTKLITENYFMPGESGGLISGGVRIFGEHLSVDAGIATTTEGGILPLVNFVYSFGGPRK
jgi:hypothetical protein